jgi:leucyl aminopeptidase
MQPAYEIPEITKTEAAASELDADLVAVPILQDQRPGAVWLEQATSGELTAAYERGEFAGKVCELWNGEAAQARTRRVLAVGAGPSADLTPEISRRLGATVGLSARQQKRRRLAFVLGESWTPALIESLVEGVALANFDGGQYKSRSDGRVFLSSVVLAGPAAAAAGDAIARGVRVGDVVNAARVLINEPGNRLTPTDLAARGQALLSLPDVTIDILDQARMEELKMGLLLGVARGSAEPPRMLVARYEPADAPRTPVLGLVGKGITFDTGGISLKPSDGMERMKDDMAGGATVIAALRAIALERLPLRVMAIVPCTENMPGGRATKPGDVHTGASGLTVEINNTDAEGRLILGDALWYAKQQGATHLVDVATLTGACIVALGKTTTGLFATDGWTDILRAAAARGGEKVWPMPLYEDYREALKSEIADMLNSPGRPAGAITAAMFLKEFVGATPWAHLDIAGTAWAEDAKAWMPKGATGVMIRTLIEVARTVGKDWP